MDQKNALARDLDEISAALAPRMDALRGQRLLIAGGTGFFGRWLVESMAWMNRRLSLGVETTILSRDPSRLRSIALHHADDKSIRFVAGDVRHLPDTLGPFDYIINAATSSSGKESAGDPLLQVDTIISGTRNLLDLAVNSQCKGFLCTSSGAVYGKQPDDVERIEETSSSAPDCLNPSLAYGQAKRTAELLCSIYAQEHGIRCVIARCFAFVGPFLPLDEHFAIGNFIRDALAGKEIKVNGDGTPLRSYMYASNLCTWLWTLLIEGQNARAYNVGSEDAVSIAELASLVAQSVSPGLPVVIAGKAAPDAKPSRYVPSTKRAQDELGLSVAVDLSDAIKRTLEYHRRTLLGK